MELFYAASDLVVARAGGAVAELTATATPSVLVPGEFRQAATSRRTRASSGSGAARGQEEEIELATLTDVV